MPEGRYIAPANSETCTQLKSGDCADRTLLIRAPFFSRFDVGLSKRIGVQGRTSIELRIEMLNVFDNINFNNAANPGTGATIFQVTTHYTDANNTFDPGGRLGQLMIRFNLRDAWRPLRVCPAPHTSSAWALWTYRWKPTEPGTYSISLKAADASIRTRRLDVFFYTRRVRIDEV